jgi:hypothetical protein
VARAWPFERLGDPEEPFRAPDDFVRRQGPEVEAVVVRIGLHDAQLVLVDRSGRWERWVYTSVEEATAAARALGLRIHEASYPEELRVLVNSYARPPQDLARAPYPEQGRVGPVIPYRENRPRRVEAPAPEEEPDVDLDLHPGLRP